MPRTPLFRLAEFLCSRLVRFAPVSRRQTSRGDSKAVLTIILAGMSAQALWLYFIPFAWGWDATPNLAIGRMYFGLPYEMWSIRHYYRPGYPIFLTLMGLHHFDTLALLKIGTMFVGGLMPLLLYLMMRRFDRNAALVAALIFAASFGNAVFSTDMMNHHFHAFLLLLMSVVVARHLDRPSNATAFVLGCAAAVANTGREVSVFVLAAAIFVLSLASWIERRTVLAPAKSTAIMIAGFVALTGAFSLARQAALGGPFEYGLTRDNGARVAFQGTYYGASIYQKEFRPGEDFVFIKPENGPASQEFLKAVRTFFATSNVRDSGLSDSSNIDEALQNLIASPNVRNTYTVYLGLDTYMSLPDQDRMLRNLVIETIVAQPRILRYFIWNFWTYLFGPPLVNEGSCVRCVCPPCFAVTMPQSYLGAFMGAEVFSKVARPGVIAAMASEHARAKLLEPYAWYLYADARLLFVAKPLLTILLLASVFLARGKTRLLMLYCVAAVLIIGGTTALAWPVQGRYQYPAIPYVLAGAVVSILEIIGRMRALAGLGIARKEPAE